MEVAIARATVRTRSSLFSYPYGGPDAVDAVTMSWFSKAGYTLACTATGGIARSRLQPASRSREMLWGTGRPNASRPGSITGSDNRRSKILA